MIRTLSTNISNQRDEGTCFAHSSARLILNAIRQTIPEFFYPLDENDTCDEYYDSINMLSVFKEDTKCSDNSFNNLMMYIYIYKLITKQFGCSSASPVLSIKWFIDYYIVDRMGDHSTILSVFRSFEGFNDEHLEKIFSICNAFIHKFHSDENNKFVVESMNITRLDDVGKIFVKLTGQTFSGDNIGNNVLIALIKYIIDNGYYILAGGNGHVMTIVNYTNEGEDFILIIKNSYGKSKIFNPSTNIFTDQGIIRITIDKAIQINLTLFSFIIPTYINESDKSRIKEENERQRSELDRIDAEFRRKYKDSQLAKVTNDLSKKGGKKIKKYNKSKKIRKTKNNKYNKSKKIRKTKKKN